MHDKKYIDTATNKNSGQPPFVKLDGFASTPKRHLTTALMPTPTPYVANLLRRELEIGKMAIKIAFQMVSKTPNPNALFRCNNIARRIAVTHNIYEDEGVCNTDRKILGWTNFNRAGQNVTSLTFGWERMGRLWKRNKVVVTHYAAHFVNAHIIIASIIANAEAAGLIENVMDTGHYLPKRDPVLLSQYHEEAVHFEDERRMVYEV